MMNEKILKFTKKPEIYAPSTVKFWDDEHISKMMLESHLDTSHEAASRSPEFLDKSVEWITTIAPPSKGNRLLDLGCGPGLYTQRLHQKGYEVTGVDFSKRSINYATTKAQENNWSIEYIYKNYLDIDYENEFDVIIMIYCDFAVLSPNQRDTILKKIKKALKDGGKFIFDVFTPANYFDKTQDKNDWFISGPDFWSAEEHLCLESHFIYPSNARCDQYVLIMEDKVEVVRVWDQPFTPETISPELNSVGFRKIEIFSDVSGIPYYEQSSTMAIVVTKK